MKVKINVHESKVENGEKKDIVSGIGKNGNTVQMGETGDKRDNTMNEDK